MSDPQTIADRYVIDDRDSSLIGQGGMGSVFLGREIASGRPVAIKRLQPELVATDPEIVERFAREGEALRQLDHPNIVKVLDTIQENGRHYIVMDYVAGGSLRQLMDHHGQLDLDLVLTIGLEIADALSRAHHLNIIHRDIKPANVLLEEDNSPRLTDFGIALIGDQSRITQAGSLAGTYAYLCPEAWDGRVLDGRADIWSFGVLLYEMLAGMHPFEAETLTATFAGILNKEPAPLLELRPDVPGHLAELIHGMMRKDPKQRIASVRLVGATLEAVNKGEATPGSAGQPSRFDTPAFAAYMAPSNLPLQSTPFIGRQQELADIATRLSESSCRLLTLVGPGGIGKTRLALQAAENERTRFRHGIFLVQLAPLSSPESIVPTIAESIGFSFYRTDDPDRIGPSPRQQLLDHLREKEMLLVLDNYEHLLERADLAADILANAPQTKLLATSRERLNILGEWVLPIRGLAYPTDELPDVPGTGITAYSSVQLYVQRASQMGVAIELDAATEAAVIRICQLVDGTPLAIELAASWLQTLTPEEIADEVERNYAFLETTLRDMPERHRSLRLVFENSWNLLDSEAQRFLAKLSVFRGDFDLDAATFVAADGNRDGTLAHLAGLVGKSLLKREATGRYALHQLLHQFAFEKLETVAVSSEANLGSRTHEKHSDYYCSLLHTLKQDLRTRRKKKAITAVEQDIENVRAAWRWAAQHDKAENIAQALTGLVAFLSIQNWQQEGDDLLGYAIDGIGRDSPERTLLLARLCAWRAGFIAALGELDEAERILQASLVIFREQDSPADEAATLNGLAQVAAARGFLVQAADHHKRSLALFRQIGDDAGVASQITQLGRIANERGRYEESRALLNQALEMRRELGDLPGVAGVLDTLGFNAYRLGDGRSAAKYADESVLIHESIGHRAGVANAVRLKGMVASLSGDYDRAWTYYEEALAIRQEIGNRGAVGGSYTQLSHLALLTGDYAAAKDYSLKCLAIGEEINNQWSLIYALNNLGLAQVRLGELHDGRQSLLRALGIARDMNAGPLALEILLGFAELAAAQGQERRALDLLCIVRNHPAQISETWQLAMPLYDRLVAAVDLASEADPCPESDAYTLEQAIEGILQ